jgi:hypothetical protein
MLSVLNGEIERRTTKISQLQSGTATIQPQVTNFDPHVNYTGPDIETIVTGNYTQIDQAHVPVTPTGNEPAKVVVYTYSGETVIGDAIGFTNTNLLTLDTSSRITYLEGMLDHHRALQTQFNARVEDLQNLVNVLSTASTTTSLAQILN